MINRIVGLHFSPGGGTATITEELINEIAERISSECAADVSCETYDIFRRPDSIPEFDENTIAVIGMPVRIGKLPIPAIRILNKLEGSGAMSIALVSYGASSYGNALYELYRLAEDRGFKVVGAGAFISRHINSEDGLLTRPNKEDLQALGRFAVAATGKIKRLAGCEIEGLKVEPAPINLCGSIPIHRISRLSPEAAALAERTLEKLFACKSDPEWYL